MPSTRVKKSREALGSRTRSIVCWKKNPRVSGGGGDTPCTGGGGGGGGGLLLALWECNQAGSYACENTRNSPVACAALHGSFWDFFFICIEPRRCSEGFIFVAGS